jgi:hypothetical protein
MPYYTLPFLLWFMFCTLRALQTDSGLRFPHYVWALPLIFLAVFRGEIGPDTATYLWNAQKVIWWGGRDPSNEIGFELLLRGLAFLTSDPRVVVALISLIAAVLFFTMLQTWNDGRAILSLVLIPIAYFDFTMNGLRMGIAFPLAVLAVLQLEKERPVRFCLLALLSISMQMTAALLLPMLFLARWEGKLTWKRIGYGLLLGVAVLYPAYSLFADRLALKLLAYSIVYSPTNLSGTGPLLISFCASLLALWTCPRHRHLGIAFFLLQVACFGISSLSYAGLRLQEMALFAQLLALSYWTTWPIRKTHLAAMALLCCLAFSWTARNFMTTSGEPSAFLPYRFVWEER